MGCSYYAYTIIGVPFHEDDLTESKRVKAFKHDYPEDFEFCPKTKKALWREEVTSIFGEDVEPGYGEIGGVAQVQPDDDDPTVYVGHYQHAGEYDSTKGPIPPGVVGETKALVKSLLEEYGLWDESKFGIYTVFNASC